MNIPFADSLLHASIRHASRNRPISPLATLNLGSIKRVLLVLTTGLGDAILSTPVFPNLRRALPNADIRLFCRNGWQSLFENDPALNEIIGYKGKYRDFFNTIRTLREFSPDLTLVLHGNDPDILPLAYLAGSEYILRIPTRQTRYPFLLSNRDRKQDETTTPGLHYIENRLRILDTLDIATPERNPKIYLAQSVHDEVKHKLQFLFGSNTRYWVFHTFAADAYKVWPLDKARALLQTTLASMPELNVVLTGSAADRDALTQLTADLPGNRIANIAGQFSLAETAACIADAAFLTGPDTGILHLAAAVGTPAIGLYAATSAALVGPRSAHMTHHIIQKAQTCEPCVSKKCPYTPKNCMDQISVDEVKKEMLAILSKARP